jgi:hypothetical protein
MSPFLKFLLEDSSSLEYSNIEDLIHDNDAEIPILMAIVKVYKEGKNRTR